MIKNVKYNLPWIYATSDLNDEEIIGTFYKKELQRMNRTEFRVKKIKKIKSRKLYVKWKGYDSSLNSRISTHLRQNYLYSEYVKKIKFNYFLPYLNVLDDIIFAMTSL